MREEVENPMVRYNAKDVLHKRVGVSNCYYCDMRLFADENFFSFNGNHFCDTTCLFDNYDIVKIKGRDLLD
jgi:hypothetical protein